MAAVAEGALAPRLTMEERSFIAKAIEDEERRIAALRDLAKLRDVKDEGAEGPLPEGEDAAATEEDRITSKEDGNADGNVLPAKRNSSGTWASQKRRIARNYREQKRAHRITDVIDQLKATLVSSSFPIASQSKYHVLQAASTYVTYLERKERCFLMEKEQLARLAKERLDTRSSMPAEEVELAKERVGIVRVDFSSLFHTAPIALCVASIDGRLLAVNRMFELTMGYTAEEARSLTIFSLIPQEYLHGAFEACSAMLQLHQPKRDGPADPNLKPSQKPFPGSAGPKDDPPAPAGAPPAEAPADGPERRPAGGKKAAGVRGSAREDARRSGRRRRSRPFVTYAKPKRGHQPYADCVSEGEDCVYAGGRPGSGLTQALSVERSLAASLGLHQLSLSISLSAAADDDAQRFFHVTVLEAPENGEEKAALEVLSEEEDDDSDED